MNHSISARRAGLLDVNDGRPFAWVSRSHLRDLNGTDRFILASAYCTARAQDSTSGQEAGYVTTPAKGWGPWLGLSERTARDSFTRLCHADLLTRCDWGKRLATWELNSTALALRDDGELDLRIELAPMTRPRWTCAMRSAWISLCGFVRVEQGELSCFPKQALIAVGAGVTLRNVQRALYRIESDRCLAITRRRGSALYLLHPIGDAPDTGKNRRMQHRQESTYRHRARIDVQPVESSISHRQELTYLTLAQSLTGDLERSSRFYLNLSPRSVPAFAPETRRKRRCADRYLDCETPRRTASGTRP